MTTVDPARTAAVADVHARPLLRAGPWLAVLTTASAILTINFWIYYARIAFAARHPDYVAEQPPTISRGISDPVIGEPFAAWVCVSALFILLGVVLIARLYLRSAAVLPDEAGSTRRWLRGLAPAVVAAQCASTVGIFMLSLYRFPTHDAEHMAGSYIFFSSQAVMILLAGTACTLVARDSAAVATLAGHRYLNPRISRFRGPFALGAAPAAIAYLALFLVKDIDLGSWNEPLYSLYVLWEPALITYFLIVPALYLGEIAAVPRGAAPV